MLLLVLLVTACQKLSMSVRIMFMWSGKGKARTKEFSRYEYVQQHEH